MKRRLSRKATAGVAAFRESQHPRGSHGEFTDKPGGAAPTTASGGGGWGALATAVKTGKVGESEVKQTIIASVEASAEKAGGWGSLALKLGQVKSSGLTTTAVKTTIDPATLPESTSKGIGLRTGFMKKGGFRLSHTSSGLTHSANSVSLNATEEKAILDYAEGRDGLRPGEEYLNTALRDDLPMSARQQTIVKNLDKAFGKASFPEDTVVYRGVGGLGMRELSRLKEGESYIDKSFMSSSTSVKTPLVYADRYKDDVNGSGIMAISIKKGSKSIGIEDISDFPDQQEILLNRNMKLTLKKRDGDVFYFEAEAATKAEVKAVVPPPTLPSSASQSEFIPSAAAKSARFATKEVNAFRDESMSSPATELEKGAAQLYTTSAYADVNTRLKLGKPLSSEVDSADEFGELTNQVGEGMSQVELQQHMDSLIAKTSLSKPTTLYRSVATGGLWDELKKGAVISSPGYTSTTLSDVYVQQFSHEAEEEVTKDLIRIKAPAGTHGAFVDEFSGAQSGEMELVLGRDQEMRYLGFHEDDGFHDFELVNGG